MVPVTVRLLLPKVGVLGVRLNTDDHARTRGELVVVADLTTADEAFEVVAAIGGHDHRGAGEGVQHRTTRQGVAVAVAASIEAVTGVDTEVGTRPGEHRHRHEDRGSGATRKVGGRSGASEESGGRSGEEKLLEHGSHWPVR